MTPRSSTLIAVLAPIAACTSLLGLDDKGCPCLSGYHCCESKCVPEDQLCAEAPDALGEDSTAGAFDAEAGAEADDDAGTDASADAPADVAAEAELESSVPSWHTLGLEGVGEALVISFDLQVTPDGTPFLALSKLTPPGRARVTLVLRYDGMAWQQLGADLSGTEMPVPLALAPDGTPYVLANGIHFFQKGEWKDMPALGEGIDIAPSAPGLGLDRNGRLHTLSVDYANSVVGVVRFNGTSWEQLGPRDALGTPRRFPIFGFDLSNPYVALTDPQEMTTEVRRFLPGANWELVGESVISYADSGAFAVAPDGTAYFARGNTGIIEVMKSAAAPWVSLDQIRTVSNIVTIVPSIDLAPDGAPHVAYLGDRDPGHDVVPGPMVTRWDGSRWVDLPTAGLEPNVFDAIKLRIAAQGTRAVPYIAYLRDNRLIVKKFE